MSKTYKNLISLGLGISAVLALAIMVLPLKASAIGLCGNDTSAPVPAINSVSQNSESSPNTVAIVIKGSNFEPCSSVRLNGTAHSSSFIDSSHILVKMNLNELSGSDPVYVSVVNPVDYFSGGSKYSNAVSLRINNPANTNLQVQYNNSDTSYNLNTNNSGTYSNGTQMQNNSGSNNNTNSGSSLASGAIFGYRGVFPSGLIQWILLAIVILLIIILIRKISGGAERYHNEPLKHA